MHTLTKAGEQVIERVERGVDVVVTGDAGAVRATLLGAARHLSATHGVVTVAGSAGGLSLSGLIAQLSGRGNLDDHDDAVLELGVRRLTDVAVPGQRTVIVIDAPAGVHRSAFRFLRQVSRRAPDLVYVIVSFPEMAAMLDEPGMESLRERFGSAPVVAQREEFGGKDVAGTGMSLGQAPPSVTIPPEWRDLRGVPLSARDGGRQRRRGALWAASALGVAASVTLGAWLGARSSSPAPATPASDLASYEAVPAQLSAPMVASASPAGGLATAESTAALSQTAPLAVAAGLTPMPTAGAAPALVASPTVVASAPPPVLGAVPPPGPATAPGADLARATRPEMATASAPSVATTAITEAALVLDSREQGDDGTALAGLPRDAFGRPRNPGRPTRLAAPAEALKLPPLPAPTPAAEPPTKTAGPAAEPPTKIAGSAPEERRRVLSPRPQRLATLPLSPAGAERMHPRWREEPLDDETRREARAAPYDQGPSEESDIPPVRYRRFQPPSDQAWRGERAVAPAEGQYIGTYEPGPYGARVFRYDP